MERALGHWRRVGDTRVALDVVQFCNSPFFKRYMLLTDQLVTVLDHATMKYLYVSETIATLTGYSLERLQAEGVAYVIQYMHADDSARFEAISHLLQERMRGLDRHEVLQCCTSFGYRLRYSKDNTYHHIVQHNIPLSVDEHNRIAHVMVIMWDITPYKRDDNCSYRIVQHKDDGTSVVVAEGVVGDPPSVSITEREREVLRLTAEGLTEKEISDKLFLSLHTVKSHRKNLLKKTGVANSIELIKFASANFYL